MKRTCQAISAFFVLTLLVVAGCGESPPAGTVVTGKIYKGGAPVKVEKPTEGGAIKQVYFYAQFEGGPNDVSEIADDGSFRMEGYGAGLPPGKYKIGVEVKPDFAAPDQFKDKFSEQKTTIVREINDSGEQDLGIIDLDKPNPS